MWQRQRRLAQLEKEVAEARAAHADLQRRVNLFEQIAAAAGAAMDDTFPGQSGEPETPAIAPAPVQPVPPVLKAAALDARRAGSPVRLVVGGDEVIAVIGDEGGDPGQWWAAIRRLASARRSAS